MVMSNELKSPFRMKPLFFLMFCVLKGTIHDKSQEIGRVVTLNPNPFCFCMKQLNAV